MLSATHGDEPVPIHEDRKNSKLPLDVLVVAPHPDDEVIGCAGVILRALKQEKRVAVVVITSGDGHPALAAAVVKKDRDQLTPADFMEASGVRQQHSMNATMRLGVPKEELIFLGYPDSGLEKIYQMDGNTPFRQMFTQKRETYGVKARDYHSLVHGKSAPYLKASIIGDLAEIIRTRQPKAIYVTHESDSHGDHRAAFALVRDAARDVKFRGSLFTYIVHGQPPPEPPTLTLKLTTEEKEVKRSALMDHQQGTSPVHDNLVDKYFKPEEHFWQIPTS